MYFVSAETYHGEEFIAIGETIKEVIYNLRTMTTGYAPENLVFFKGETIIVGTEVWYIEM